MDPMSLTKAANNRYNSQLYPTVTVGGSPEERLKDVQKRTTAKKPFKTMWGGTDYPVDVSIYGQFLSTLTTLAWILKDLGYEIRYLTQSGMIYDEREVTMHGHLYNENSSKIVALVAVSPEVCWRFSRDKKGLRLRKFQDQASAVAPLRDGNTSGTKPMDVGTIKEIVKFMSSRKELNPEDLDSVKNFGKFVRMDANKPRTAQPVKTRLRMEFRKH